MVVSRLLAGLLIVVQLSLIAHGGILFFTLRELESSKKPVFDENAVSEIRFNGQQIDALRKQIDAISSSRLESKSGGSTDRNSSVRQSSPAPVAKPEPESPTRKCVIDAKKIIRELGNETLVTSKTCFKWDLNTLATFLRDKGGVTIDIKDPNVAENIGHIVGKHALFMKILEKDRLINTAKARKQLEAEGRFEDIPIGTPIPPIRREPGSEPFIESVVSTSQAQRRFLIPPSEFPEILASDEKRSIESFERMLEDMGAFLADNDASK